MNRQIQWIFEAPATSKLFYYSPEFASEWEEANPELTNFIGTTFDKIQDALIRKNEPLAIRLAIMSGKRDQDQLTNMIFFARYPERQGRKLEKKEPNFRQLSQEWLEIRDRLVIPSLKQVSTNQPQLPTVTAGLQQGVTQSFITSIQSLSFRNAADINAYYLRQTGLDFVDWFNQKIAGRGYWQKKHIKRNKEVKSYFIKIWNRIPQMFDTPAINLIQFVCLMSIIINETGGALFPISEKVGRQGHPGIAYAFDRIPGFKRSYNGGSNKTAFELFNDRDFIAAHGHLALGDRLRYTQDRRWAGDRYPQADYPTSTDPNVTGFILEADFYKFRGRGLLQTTFRGSYKRLIEYILANDIQHQTISEYRQRWNGLNLDRIATISTNRDWDRLFQQTDYIIPSLAIHLHSRHSGNYLNLPLNVTTLNGNKQGSIYYVGYRVSGNSRYGEKFRHRVLQILGT